jgi:hypothetical protein
LFFLALLLFASVCIARTIQTLSRFNRTRVTDRGAARACAWQGNRRKNCNKNRCHEKRRYAYNVE